MSPQRAGQGMQRLRAQLVQPERHPLEALPAVQPVLHARQGFGHLELLPPRAQVRRIRLLVGVDRPHTYEALQNHPQDTLAHITDTGA